MAIFLVLLALFAFSNGQDVNTSALSLECSQPMYKEYPTKEQPYHFISGLDFSSKKCSWSMQVPPDVKVFMNFSYFFMVPDSRCGHFRLFKNDILLYSQNGAGLHNRTIEISASANVTVLSMELLYPYNYFKCKFQNWYGIDMEAYFETEMATRACGVPPELLSPVGGNGNIPFHAIINNTISGETCGGTLIGSQYVLSASECTHLYLRNDFRVVLGGDLTFAVLDIMEYDNAVILKIDPPVVFTNKMYPACIASYDPNPGSLAYVAVFKDTNSTFIEEISVAVLNKEDCHSNYGLNLTNSMYCGGIVGTNSCHGEEKGGPLVQKIGVDRASTLVGIVTSGAGCGAKPGVHTSLTFFNSWIKSICHDCMII